MGVTDRELEDVRRLLQVTQAELNECEALVQHLRSRTVVLNNEIRHRDATIADRDRAIAALTEQLAAGDSTNVPSDG